MMNYSIKMPESIRKIIEFLFFSAPRLSQAQINSLNHKTILITGASFGIGEAIARTFLNHTVHLILVARSQDKLDILAKELRQSGCTVDIIIADLYQTDAAQFIYTEIKQRNIPMLDLIIHNAGKSIQRSIWQSIDRPQDIDRTTAINFLNPAHLTRLFLNELRQQHGQVIVVSTINAKLFAPPLWSSYQASKTAMQQWLLAIQPELRAKNVASSLVYLPLVRTRMIAPTQAYTHMPTLTPEQAAHAVLKCAITRQRQWQPWWLGFGQYLCLVFAIPIFYFYTLLLKRKS